MKKQKVFLIIFLIEKTYECDGQSFTSPLDDQPGNLFRQLLQFHNKDDHIF
jgi:hypothetical protein